MVDRSPKTELWNPPPNSRDRFLFTMRRAISRGWPSCGGHSVFDGDFTLREQCSTCDVRVEREERYFLGGYALNLVVAELVGLGLAVFLLFNTD